MQGNGTSNQAEAVVLPLSKSSEIRTNACVIVGGVAGGMSTATRLRRLDADASITVLERSGHVSFANCGLPYFVGGLIEEEEDLTLQTPEQLFDRFRLDVRVHRRGHRHRPGRRTPSRPARRSRARRAVLGYDKLVLSMGAAPVRPPIPGYDRVRTLRTVEDAARLASRRRRGARDRGRDRCRIHRARDGREPRRSGHRRHDRRGDSPGAAPTRSRARHPRRRRARRARRPRRDRRDGRLGRGHARSRSPTGGSSRPTSWSAPSACGPMSDSPSGRAGPRAERRHRRQRGEPDQRPRHLRRRRRRREGRRDLARHVAHRARERRQSPGTPSGRPHRRATLARRSPPWGRRSSRCSTWSPRPSGGTNGACVRRVGRSERSIRTPSTMPPTTRARPAWRRS